MTIELQIACPLESLDSTLAFASKDWSLNKSDAWIYGIVAGWSDEALTELRNQFGWDSETTARLKYLHNQFNKIRAK